MKLKQISGFFAGPGGALVLLCFFLPWITVECSGSVFVSNASGNDLAEGINPDDIQMFGMDDILGDLEAEFDASGYGDDFDFDSGFGDTDVALTDSREDSFLDADATLYVLPAVGVIALFMLGLGFFDEALLGMMSSVLGYMVPAVAGGGVMLLKYLQIAGDIDDANAQAAAESGGEIALGAVEALSVTYEIGWWGTIIGLGLIFVAGIVLFLAEDDSKPKESARERALRTGQLMSEEQIANMNMDGDAPQLLSWLNEPDNTRYEPPRDLPPPADNEELKARFATAKELIAQRDFDGARRQLRNVSHPKADEWLAKIDKLDRS